MKVIKFDMGRVNKVYTSVLQLNAGSSMNIRHNSLESARMTCNRYLEKTIPNDYHLRVKVYPFHVLRENPLASGAGADRMSKGMKLAYGKPVGSAARVKEGQTVVELRIDQENIKVGREALSRAAKKLPCNCKVVVA